MAALLVPSGMIPARLSGDRASQRGADDPGVVFGQLSSGRHFGRSLAVWGLLGGEIGLLVKCAI